MRVLTTDRLRAAHSWRLTLAVTREEGAALTRHVAVEFPEPLGLCEVVAPPVPITRGGLDRGELAAVVEVREIA
jgi:hypothetical protein